LARLDPANWPPNAAVPFLALWAAWAIVCLLWAYPLVWTVLPVSALVDWRGAGFRWRVVMTVAGLFAAAMIAAQASVEILDPPWSAFGAVLGLTAVLVWGSTMFSDRVRDAMVARLPLPFIGEPLATRLSGARLERSTDNANKMLAAVEDGGDRASSARTAAALAQAARHESRRGGTWAEAWAAHAAWLEALSGDLVTPPSGAQSDHVNVLCLSANEAMRAAVERAKAIDPESASTGSRN
jgi:hypothetical protein